MAENWITRNIGLLLGNDWYGVGEEMAEDIASYCPDDPLGDLKARLEDFVRNALLTSHCPDCGREVCSRGTQEFVLLMALGETDWDAVVEMYVEDFERLGGTQVDSHYWTWEEGESDDDDELL